MNWTIIAIVAGIIILGFVGFLAIWGYALGAAFGGAAKRRNSALGEQK